MARNFGTDKNGNNFKVDTQLLVWKHIPPYDTVVNKKQDACGTTIELFKYGKQTSTGWEIDHIKPVAKGGNDNLENLQALQRENNRSKGDKYLTNPSEYCTGTKEAGFTYIPAAPRYRSKKKPKIGRKSSKAPKDKKPVSNEAPKTNQESFDERLKILPKKVTNKDKVLLTAYYILLNKKGNSFTIREINKTLKEKGIKIPNPSNLIRDIASSQPTLRQVFNKGKKHYQFTKEGEEYIRDLLSVKERE